MFMPPTLKIVKGTDCLPSFVRPFVRLSVLSSYVLVGLITDEGCKLLFQFHTFVLLRKLTGRPIFQELCPFFVQILFRNCWS